MFHDKLVTRVFGAFVQNSKIVPLMETTKVAIIRIIRIRCVLQTRNVHTFFSMVYIY